MCCTLLPACTTKALHPSAILAHCLPPPPQGRLDQDLPASAFDVLQLGLNCAASFVLLAIALPYILPLFLPLALLFVWLRQTYLGASREVKRWEALTRSPVYASFTATLRGLATIRAFAAQGHFYDRCAACWRWWLLVAGCAGCADWLCIAVLC